jgi:hypothetical protein
MVDQPTRTVTSYLHVVLELAEPWLLLTELARLQRVSKACAHALPLAARAVDRDLIRDLFANRSTLDPDQLPIRGLAVWEMLAWRTRAARAAKRVEIIRGRATDESRFCSHREAHPETNPPDRGARLFGGHVLLCNKCVLSMSVTGIKNMVALFGLSKNAVRRRFPRLAGHSTGMIFPLDLITSGLVAQALGSSRTLRKQAVAGGSRQREYPRVLPHGVHAARIRRLRSHPVTGPLIRVDAKKGDGIDTLEFNPSAPGQATRSLQPDQRAEIKDLLSYVTARLNLPLDETLGDLSIHAIWLADTTITVEDRLTAWSPSLVQPTTQSRLRQTLLKLLRYRELGFRLVWRHGIQRLAPNRWALLTELLAIFLGLPKGGCSGTDATVVLFARPTRSRFRWVVPSTKVTRKRKRKDP